MTVVFQVQCCFTSTETVQTIRDRKPTTAVSIFTQFLSSEAESQALVNMVLNVHRNDKAY